MENDELTKEDLLGFAKPRENGDRIPFEFGMNEDSALCCKANLFLRQFFGETACEKEEYGKIANENYELEHQLSTELEHIGRMIVNTAIAGKYASWDSHYNSHLDWAVRTATTLAECFGYKPAEIIKVCQASLEEEINRPINGGDAYIAQAFAELGGEIPEGCETVKDLAQSMKDKRVLELEKELEYLAAIPLTKDGQIDREEIFRQAMVRSVGKYQTERAKFKPELCNYNRKSDVMYDVANLGLRGNLPEAEIKEQLSRVQAMKFD